MPTVFQYENSICLLSKAGDEGVGSLRKLCPALVTAIAICYGGCTKEHAINSLIRRIINSNTLVCVTIKRSENADLHPIQDWVFDRASRAVGQSYPDQVFVVESDHRNRPIRFYLDRAPLGINSSEIFGTESLEWLALCKQKQISFKRYPLEDMVNLKRLYFNGSVLSDQLHHLARTPSLEYLNISTVTHVGFGGNKPDIIFRHLKQLDAYGVRFSEDDISFLAEAAPHLERLDLSDCKFELSALTKLSQLPNLEVLLLRRVELDSDSFDALASYPSLQEINFGETNVTDSDLSRLNKLKSLNGLRLNNCKLVTGEFLEEMKKNRPYLTVDMHGTASPIAEYHRVDGAEDVIFAEQRDNPDSPVKQE